MSNRIATAGVVFFVISATAIAQRLPNAHTDCNVTAPNGVVAGQAEPREGSHGNALLSVGPFGLWSDGTVVFKPGGAGLVTADGALRMKFGWTRAVPGPLKIGGHRVDADAPPLRSDIPCCYDATGFQASALIFPTVGCWEVTAQIGERDDSKLTFVTRVVRIG